MEVVTSTQMKQIEQNALAYELTFHRLMENAGSAAAAFIRRTFQVSGLNIMVFCSKGNNGGDGFVAARKLTESGANVVVVLLDGLPATEEAVAMYNTLQMMQVPVVEYASQRHRVTDFLAQSDIIIDAICGTGFRGKLRDLHREACRAINEAIAAVVSLDIPTGVECDSGAVDSDAVRADFTVAFDRAKPCHVLPSSAGYCGMLEIVEIGIPPQAHDGVGGWQPSSPPVPEAGGAIPDTFQFVADDPEPLPQVPETLTFLPPEEPAPPPSPPAQPASIPAPAPAAQSFAPASSLTLEDVFQILQPRPANSHKGTFGRLLNISGSQQFTGAASLSTKAALRCGCGLVTLASIAEVCALAGGHVPEATFLPLAKSAVGGVDFEGSAPVLSPYLERSDAILFGCGLGNTSHTSLLLDYVLEMAGCPVVIDADGINALAANIHVLQKAAVPVVLTPHTGEMSRLCGLSVQEIEENREEVAVSFAREHNVTLVLKGPGTLIAGPEGSLLRNTTGNPGLAKGGSGDILAGMVASLLAQGIPPAQSAACGVFLHGLAGDRTAARRSQYAMLPSELLDDLAMIFLENGR